MDWSTRIPREVPHGRGVRARPGWLLVGSLLLAFLQSPYAADRGLAVRLERGINLFSHPVRVPAGQNCVELQAQLGALSVLRLDPDAQTFEKCEAPNHAFPIAPGAGYVVDMPASRVAEMAGEEDCPALDLSAGVNLIGVPGPPPDLTCFGLLRAIADHAIADDPVGTIQGFDSRSGRLESCGFSGRRAGEAIGMDFEILAGKAYFVFMKQPLASFDANRCASLPVIAALDPTVVYADSTILDFRIEGRNLVGSSFSLDPEANPPPATFASVTIDPGGASADLELRLAADSAGSFLVVAHNAVGSSTRIASRATGCASSAMTRTATRMA